MRERFVVVLVNTLADDRDGDLNLGKMLEIIHLLNRGGIWIFLLSTGLHGIIMRCFEVLVPYATVKSS